MSMLLLFISLLLLFVTFFSIYITIRHMLFWGKKHNVYKLFTTV